MSPRIVLGTGTPLAPRTLPQLWRDPLTLSRRETARLSGRISGLLLLRVGVSPLPFVSSVEYGDDHTIA